jgi:hypothetical protein
MTVKSGGGGDYTTIQACANATSAGDTCVVYAGTYNEVVTLSHAGTGTSGVCSACITYTVNPGDTVNVYGFTVSASYNIISRFTITDPTFSHALAGVYFSNAYTGVQILNNTITQVGQGYPCVSMRPSQPDPYTTITGNTISWCGQNANVAHGATVYGDNSVFLNNSISHTPNGIAISGSNIVVRGNSYGPVNDAVDFPGCHEEQGCDTHVDYVEFGSNVLHALIESNYEHDILGVGGAHAWLMQSTSSYSIQRFNTISNVGSGYLLADTGGFSYIKDYNNTIVNDLTQASDTGIACWNSPANNGAFLNDLMYNDTNPPGTSTEYYVTGSGVTGFVGSHNLAWDTACSPETLAHCTFGRMLTDSGNVYADPLFVNPNGDWSLQQGSPALNAGTYLTTVASNDSGSGTSLIVNDVGYFQAFGIPGVTADCIAVTSTTNHVCITAVNYQTNTLTLASSITRTQGDSVWLYSDSTGRQVLFGTAPNIGATFGPSSPAAPTGLQAFP